VVLEGRDQADYTLWNQDRRLSECMGGLDVGVWELIKATSRADDRLVPDKTGQCLRADAFGDEIL